MYKLDIWLSKRGYTALLYGTHSRGASILIIQATTHALQVNIATEKASSQRYAKKKDI